MALPKLRLSDIAARSPEDALLGIFELTGVHVKTWSQEHGSDDPFIVSSAVGAPDPGMLPIALNDRLHAAATGAYGSAMLNYRPGSFEAAMQQYLLRRGVVLPNTVGTAITSGGMEAINLGIRVLVNPGDTVIIEAPGFTGTISGLREVGARIVQLDIGDGGMTPAVLEAAIREHHPKLVSLMPDCQNPTGARMPLEHRQAIGALLQKLNVFALEDAAYAELGFDATAKLPPLQSFAPEHVVYATSFSKILWPAIRVGYLVADKCIAESARRMKFNFNMVTSPEALAKVEQFLTLDNGQVLQDRLALLRSTYAARYTAMDQALAMHLDMSQWSWRRPQGGMFIYATGPDGLDFGTLFPQALEHGFAYVPGAKCYADEANAPRNTLRLNFASTPEERSALVGVRLARLMERALQ